MDMMSDPDYVNQSLAVILPVGLITMPALVDAVRYEFSRIFYVLISCGLIYGRQILREQQRTSRRGRDNRAQHDCVTHWVR